MYFILIYVIGLISMQCAHSFLKSTGFCIRRPISSSIDNEVSDNKEADNDKLLNYDSGLDLGSTININNLIHFRDLQKPRDASGNLYVNDQCIDCDVCRWMCPTVFKRHFFQSYVSKQPETNAEKLQAYAAMISCPVNAIQMKDIADPLVNTAASMFPCEIDGVLIPGICHTGYHSFLSQGATPYFIYRAEGNIMIDCPRYDESLADTIEKEGGISSMIFTHKEDVADHKKWKARFPTMERIIHLCDLDVDDLDIEVRLSGNVRWHPSPDIDIIHTAGHTAGSLSILYRGPVEPALFTGDHISFSTSKGRLEGWKRLNRGSKSVQYHNIQELASDEYVFNWILPAHGKMVHFANMTEKNEALTSVAEIFRQEEGEQGLDIGYY